MTNKSCDIEIKELDGMLEISLRGEIDHHSAINVRGKIDGEIARICPSKTVIDLSGIEFMDSSGLGLIMGRYALMQKMGGALSVKNPNPRIIKIFELAGLEKIVEIERSEVQRAERSYNRTNRKRRKAKGRGVRNENKGE